MMLFIIAFNIRLICMVIFLLISSARSLRILVLAASAPSTKPVYKASARPSRIFWISVRSLFAASSDTSELIFSISLRYFSRASACACSFVYSPLEYNPFFSLFSMSRSSLVKRRSASLIASAFLESSSDRPISSRRRLISSISESKPARDSFMACCSARSAFTDSS